jgi:hypothetical protein
LTNGIYLDLDLTEEDFNKSYLDLISKIYLKSFGCNSFVDKLTTINKAPITKKNILFLTSDTLSVKIDKHSTNYKTQLESFEYSNSKNLIILNLRRSKFNISYHNLQKNINLIEGNKINVFIFIIKEIYESYNLKFNINNLINRFTNLSEVYKLEPLPVYKNILSEDKIIVMYDAFKNNLAPIKI